MTLGTLAYLDLPVGEDVVGNKGIFDKQGNYSTWTEGKDNAGIPFRGRSCASNWTLIAWADDDPFCRSE